MQHLRHYSHVKGFTLHLGEIIYLLETTKGLKTSKRINQSYSYYLNRLAIGNYYI